MYISTIQLKILNLYKVLLVSNQILVYTMISKLAISCTFRSSPWEGLDEFYKIPENEIKLA